MCFSLYRLDGGTGFGGFSIGLEDTENAPVVYIQPITDLMPRNWLVDDMYVEFFVIPAASSDSGQYIKQTKTTRAFSLISLTF